MPITPLPQFEADLAEHLKEKEDREAYERLRAPTTIVVRFGVMGMVGEFPYRGDAKPGCGSKIVVRTHRGHEIGEMLTSTCPNAGCSKSVTRKQMLEYIENSGGRDYPFFSRGQALRVATAEDMDRQARLEQSRHELRTACKAVAERRQAPLKIVDVEPILGGERTTVYFTSDDRLDTRDLAREMSAALNQHVEMRHVGARDEARITADYERCGQYCCCKNFLKVLKPVSMKSAKTQKATLDPLKISGRCGRLMCCLRYEDQTYDELRRRLPRRKARVGTPDGDGVVIDTQILTQLALIRLDSGEQVAVPVEELGEPGAVAPRERPAPEERRPSRRDAPGGDEQPGERRRRKRKRRAESDEGERERDRERSGDSAETADPGAPSRKKKRRRRRKRRPETDASSPSPDSPESRDDAPPADSGAEGQAPRKKKRRRRRKRRPPGEGGEGSGPPSPPASD